MGSQKYERTRNGVHYVRHNGRLCPLYPLRLVAPPPPAYPTDDPDWPRFVAFVEGGGVVRRDLLDPGSDAREDDWRFAWSVFKAGASGG